MTEKRLIDANKLLEDMNNYNVDIEVNGLDSDEEKMRKACQAVHDHTIECINKQPTISLNGRCYEKWDDFKGKPRCPKCKCVFPEDYYQWNFCPVCGTYMGARHKRGTK